MVLEEHVLLFRRLSQLCIYGGSLYGINNIYHVHLEEELRTKYLFYLRVYVQGIYCEDQLLYTKGFVFGDMLASVSMATANRKYNRNFYYINFYLFLPSVKYLQSWHKLELVRKTFY